MIKTTNLSYCYVSGQPISFPDIEIQQHGLILGPSGVGKTTLLHLFAGLITPQSGEIIINEITTSNLSRKQSDKFRGEHIGLIFQQPHAIKSLTLWQNLELLQKVGRGYLDREFIGTLIQQLNLEDVQQKSPRHLSLGQKQRLSIAMALVNKPAIVLADEPTSSLDDKLCEQVADLLLIQASDANAQLIVITHDHRIKHHFDQHIEL